MTACGALPIGWLSGLFRGYLGGITALVGIVVMTQLATALGGGSWVPWAAPALWAGAAGPAAAASVTPLQLCLPVLVGVAGTVASICWWDRLQLGNAAG